MALGSGANSRSVTSGPTLRLLLCLAAVTGGIAACTAPPPELSISEEEGTRLIARLNLIKTQVFELKFSDRLPGLAQSDTGGELVILPITEAMKNTDILTARMQEVIGLHQETYVVNVDFKERKLRYLLAAEGAKVWLLSAFEEKDGVWVEIGQVPVPPQQATGEAPPRGGQSGSEAQRGIIQMFDAAEVLPPSHTNSYPRWDAVVSLSGGPTVSVKAGPQPTDTGDLVPALAKVVLKYGDESKSRTLWNYTDYASVVDVRVDRGQNLLLFRIDLTIPGVLKWRQRRDVYAFDLEARRQLGVQTAPPPTPAATPATP